MFTDFSTVFIYKSDIINVEVKDMKKLVLISACLLVFASCGPKNVEPKETSLGKLNFANGVVTWDSFVGSGIEVKGLKDENFRDVVGNSFQVTKNDILTFRAKGGDGYVDGKSNTKYIITTLPATSGMMLEDGSEDGNGELQDKYKVTKYDSGWKDTTATLVLDESNADISEGKCVKLDYYYHGTWFSYAQDVTIPGSFDTFSFFARGGDSTKYSMTFQITKNVLIAPGFDLVGVYFSYKDENPSELWQQRTITMSDDNWNINYGGKDYKFGGDKGLQKTLADGGFYINSLGDFLPFFDQFQLRAYAPYRESGPHAACYFDEVKLSNTGKTESETKTLYEGFAVKDNYVVKSDSFTGRATKVDDNNVNLVIDVKGNKIELPIAVTHNTDKTKKLTCTVPNFDFEMTVFSKDNGQSLEIISVTGSAANQFNNFKCEAFTMLDNFESYSETGVGYDQGHAKDARTGMRANYYSDFWDSTDHGEGNGSPVGGSSWWLMDPEKPYSELVTDEKHEGNKAAKITCGVGNAYRYMTYGLSDGTSENKPFRGTTFSFFAKGSTVDLKLKVRVYSITLLAPATQLSDNEYLEITIPANSDWTEYTVTLKASKTYYGFSMTSVAHWTGSDKYVYIDDINVYGSMSPWSAQ